MKQNKKLNVHNDEFRARRQARLLPSGPRPPLLCKKRVCCGAKLPVLKKCFHISLLVSFNAVVSQEAKDDFASSHINAMNSRIPGVCAAVTGTCDISALALVPLNDFFFFGFFFLGQSASSFNN